jgi:hypothetical protein
MATRDHGAVAGRAGRLERRFRAGSTVRDVHNFLESRVELEGARRWRVVDASTARPLLDMSAILGSLGLGSRALLHVQDLDA